MRIEIPEFKIRSSAASKIIAGNVGASQSQLDNIAKMELRDKPMSAIQQKKYDKDIFARDNPELPAGAKTYCKQWLKEQPGFYGRRKQLKSKYVSKGNECEDAAIELLNNVHLESYVKNTEQFSNDFMTGEPDIISEPMTRDTKCSWDSSTLPLFEESCDTDYYWQGLVYMNLTGKRRHSVDYCLIDTPMHLIEREAKYACYSMQIPEGWTFEELYEEKLSEKREDMTFGHVDLKLRIKSFEFAYDQSKIDFLIERVKLCREYIKTLVGRFE